MPTAREVRAKDEILRYDPNKPQYGLGNDKPLSMAEMMQIRTLY